MFGVWEEGELLRNRDKMQGSSRKDPALSGGWVYDPAFFSYVIFLISYVILKKCEVLVLLLVKV